MILLVGGTGTVGRLVAARLQAGGHHVAVVSRKPAEARMLLGPGVEIVPGDLANPEALADTLSQANRLYLATESSADQVRLETALIDMARAAKVGHVVKLSGGLASYGATNVYGRYHAEIEAHLVGSGMDWTILRPNWFMENFLGMAGGIAAQGIVYGAAGDRKIGFVAAADIAEVAALALTRDDHGRTIHTITGPELLSFNDAAAQLSDVLGRQIPYVDVTPDAFAATLRDAGFPAPVVHLLTAGFRSVRDGSFDTITETVPALTGRTGVRLRDFLADHADAFASTG